LRNETAENLTARAVKFVSQTLRVSVNLQPPRTSAPSLMAFLTGAYAFSEASIADQPYILIAARGEHRFPLDYMVKHLGRVSEAYGMPAILLLATMTRHRCDQLVAGKVAFVVPGRQLYLPEIGLSLQDRCDAVLQPRHQSRPSGTLSPTAQALVLRAALRRDGESDLPCTVCTLLGVSFTTTLKAAAELVAAGLADRMRNGQAAPLVFRLSGRELFEAALPRLASPVAWKGFYRGGQHLDRLRAGGEMALSDQTMLAHPRIKTYCAFKQPLGSVAYRHALQLCDAEDAQIAVEIWSYDPAALSEGPYVDPLSLYLQFRNSHDDRIAICSNELLDSCFDAL
jgi:hypothetical protein